MKFDFYELIRALTSLQLLLIFLVLLLYRSNGRLHKILSLSIFAQATYIICGVFNGYQKYIINNDLQIVFYIAFTFIYLIGPSLYFYVKFITDKKFKFRLHHLSHILLFVIILVLNPLYLKIPSTDLFLFNIDLNPNSLTVLAIVLLHIQILTYLIVSVYVIHKYQYTESYSLLSNKGENRLNWIRFMLLSFLFIWFLESLIYFTYAYYFKFLCETKILLASSQFVIINWIIYLGLNKPEILNADPNKTKYQKNLIKKEVREKHLGILLQFMETETPYLDPSFTLNNLSDRTDIPTNHISQVLNIDLQKTFYDFINSYRIEISKKLILSSTDPKLTILEIMYDSGFNSKSVFNNAFKKATGLTPTEFKKRQKF